MSGVIDGWRVVFHLNDANGKPLPWLGPQTENVAIARLAGAGSLTQAQYDIEGIKTILVANGKVPAGSTLVIDSISNAGWGWTL